MRETDEGDVQKNARPHQRSFRGKVIRMATKQIEIPSWVLLESLGHVNCELVDVDLEGDIVNLTMVEGDKE